METAVAYDTSTKKGARDNAHIKTHIIKRTPDYGDIISAQNSITNGWRLQEALSSTDMCFFGRYVRVCVSGKVRIDIMPTVNNFKTVHAVVDNMLVILQTTVR